MNNDSDLLALWEHEEAEIRARHSRGGAGCGVARLDQVAGKSGMQMFDAMLNGELPFAPIAETLDFILMHIDKGHAVLQGRPLEKHYNPLGTVHGGWYATLLDSAVACAVHSTLPVGKSYTTLELKLNMLRALTKKVRLVRAEGRIIHVGGQVATAEGRLIGPDGKLYAHATTTCLIFDIGNATQARS